MAEYAEDRIEKLRVVPLVRDCATPTLASDDDDVEGHSVATVGEPNEGDVPTWTASDRKYRPQPGGGLAGMVPTFIASTETFTIPDNRQALFATAIDNEGAIALGANAFLIFVD